ncbi:MAG: helix-turn-helix domain-containing protein [Thermoleophilaceae bacterium]
MNTPGSDAAGLIRSARRRSGLTQAQLGRRLQTSQAAIARLERAGANPTVATLRKALAATGHGLELQARERPSSVDLAQLLRHARLTPAERLTRHQTAYDNLRAMLAESEWRD